MKLQEIAEAMATRLNLKLERLEEGKAFLSGRSAELVVSAFFGGWQVEMQLPGFRPTQFFEEDIRMLVQRVNSRLNAYEERERQLGTGGSGAAGPGGPDGSGSPRH